jgi:hypothetical protein
VRDVQVITRWRLSASKLFGSEDQAPSSIKVGLLLTVLTWLLSRFIVSVTWGQTRNPLSANPYNWARWDSVNYLSIAQHGLTFGSCSSPPFSSQPNPLGFRWCGTAGWLPGYPLVVRFVHSLGIGLPNAGLLVSWLAMAAAIFLVWFGWGRGIPQGRAFLVLLLFALFPGAVYNFALFPTSLALVGVVGALLAAIRERFLIGAVLMTAAGLCYPTVWTAAIGLAIGLVVAARRQGTKTVIRRALWGAAGLSSLVLLPFFEPGRPDAYFTIIMQPGALPRGIPGQDFLRYLFTQNTAPQRRLGRTFSTVLAVQVIVACSVSAAAVWVTERLFRRGEGTNSLLYPALAGLCVVLGLVLVSNAGAWNRSVVIASPCVVCFRRVPIKWLLTILVVVGLTTGVMSGSFFNNSLV